MKEVYEKYYLQLVYFGRKLIDNRQVVEDIVVDCIVGFFEHDYAPKLAKVILYKCVKNKCINYMKSQKTHDRINTNNFTEEYIGLEIIEAGFLKILSDALSTLTPDRRNIIIMYYLEEKSCVEIAKLLNKTPSTVRSLKKLGLDDLFKLKHLRHG